MKTMFLNLSIIIIALLLFSCSKDEKLATELFNKAKSMESAGDFVSAYDQYENILKEYPKTETASKCSTSLKQITSKVFRFGVKYDPVSYPQDTPENHFRSLHKCIINGNYEYIAAHLQYIDMNNLPGEIVKKITEKTFGEGTEKLENELVEEFQEMIDGAQEYEDKINTINKILKGNCEIQKKGNRIEYEVELGYRRGDEIQISLDANRWFVKFGV